jgi:hypothetical protein
MRFQHGNGGYEFRNAGNSDNLLKLDSSGNLGLGVTPSAWYSNRKAMQIGGGVSLAGVSGSAGFELRNNAYLNASGSEIYLNSDYATLYASFSGQHRWYTAPSGTAGNAISFTQAMTLTSSGNLLVGATSDISGNGAVGVFGNNSGSGANRWAAYFGTNSSSSNPAPGFGLTIGWNKSGGGGETNIVYGTAAGSTPGLAFSSSDGTTLTERARIDSSGNLLVGITSAQAKLSVKQSLSGTYGSAGLWITDNATTSLMANNVSSGVSGVWSSGALAFGTGANNFTERARIDSSGNLLVGRTADSDLSTGTTISNAGWIRAVQTSTKSVFTLLNSTGALIEFRYATTSAAAVGSISTNGSSTSYNTSSDYRLKNSIAPMTGALAKVAALKPCTYKWNADGSDGEGFIAHELAEVCPQAVTGEKDAVDAEGNPVYQGIDTSFLVATLTAAIQEQQAIIEDLKSRLTAAGL